MSLGSLMRAMVVVAFTLMRHGGRLGSPGSLYSRARALGLVGFIRCRWVYLRMS